MLTTKSCTRYPRQTICESNAGTKKPSSGKEISAKTWIQILPQCSVPSAIFLAPVKEISPMSLSELWILSPCFQSPTPKRFLNILDRKLSFPRLPHFRPRPSCESARRPRTRNRNSMFWGRGIGFHVPTARSLPRSSEAFPIEINEYGPLPAKKIVKLYPNQGNVTSV